jgi:hypothetical protein
MKILVDLWVLDENNRLGNLSFEEEIFFKTIWEFVYDRVHILEAEIDKEESEADASDPENALCIMIEIIRKRLSFNGYSQQLRDKLMACFNDNDQQILNQRFEQAYGYLN